MLLIVNRIEWTKGICHKRSRGRHFPSLPGDRYLKLTKAITGPKSRRTSFGATLWHCVQRYCSIGTLFARAQSFKPWSSWEKKYARSVNLSPSISLRQVFQYGDKTLSLLLRTCLGCWPLKILQFGIIIYTIKNFSTWGREAKIDSMAFLPVSSHPEARLPCPVYFVLIYILSFAFLLKQTAKFVACPKSAKAVRFHKGFRAEKWEKISIVKHRLDVCCFPSAIGGNLSNNFKSTWILAHGAI